MESRVAVGVLALAAICVVGAGLTASTAAGPTTQPATGGAPKPAAASYPTPGVVPLFWQFDIELDPLRSISVVLPEQGKATKQLFWYLRYTVTNRTDTDHIFVPEFVLYTGTGQLLRSGTKTPTSVFSQIKSLLADPMLKDQTSMTRKLLRGEDNAKTGVAIWPDFSADTGEIDIFITGLSGETVPIDLPKPVKVVETDWLGNKKTVTKSRLLLAKTLHLRYSIPGEKGSRKEVTPELVKKEWVMR